MTTETDWDTRIHAARTAREAAERAELQLLRDAAAAGEKASDIARAWGAPRHRVWQVLRSDDESTIESPDAPITIYLRGAGRGESTWQQVHAAMWKRGWQTTSDRTSAWHLARGGHPVVFCDFSTSLDETPGNWYGYCRYVIAGLVRARYDTTPREAQIGDLLPTAAAVKYMGESWTQIPVTVEGRDMDLPMLTTVKADEPKRYDPQALNAGGRLGCDVLDAEQLADIVEQALKLG